MPNTKRDKDGNPIELKCTVCGVKTFCYCTEILRGETAQVLTDLALTRVERDSLLLRVEHFRLAAAASEDASQDLLSQITKLKAENDMLEARKAHSVLASSEYSALYANWDVKERACTYAFADVIPTLTRLLREARDAINDSNMSKTWDKLIERLDHQLAQELILPAREQTVLPPVVQTLAVPMEATPGVTSGEVPGEPAPETTGGFKPDGS